MATKFLEPGGDATFDLNASIGFWSYLGGGATLVSDFVHGVHQKSIRHFSTTVDTRSQVNNVVQDTGTRMSVYIYLSALPTATACLFGNYWFQVRITSAGVLQLWSNSAYLGISGSTLSTGQWYRLSIAYTITSTTVNEFRVFKNGVSDMSATNVTLTAVGGAFSVGSVAADATFDFRASDHYVDDSSSLTDTGDIWVTAKRPNANGTTNGFSTQIGSGGSGYGTGHSPQVNERALSTTNGWSMVGAGAAVTEEYNIEAKGTGDIDISAATIVDWLGWVSVSALAGTPTIQIILDGANNAQAINTTITLYTKIKGSSTYPTGTGADIGIVTGTDLTTESFYECGVIVSYIPAVPSGPANLKSLNTNLKANIKSINTNLIANVKSLDTIV